MGTNRRYPDTGEQRAQQRRLQAARSHGPLRSLSDEQLQLSTRVVSLAPDRGPMWAMAWVRFGDTDVRCTARVMRWTDEAVGIEFEVGDEKMRCWVWQGAVQRTEGRPVDA
ncbi:hypothetical protein [Klenkia sp. PcliD-1-E]|uniref:hypothetical protein n=1 Tax=Klenkia sp. PcliD-1-E TaxID=2954492 RepID=UPI002096ED7E|nr:hypothetical protein [Klenkia sp. PcliD-1-E]MCO7218587.1 hypothetical protein [Klenkia sp. PcliD-1-E]